MTNYIDGRTDRFCDYLFCYRVHVRSIVPHSIKNHEKVYVDHPLFNGKYLTLPIELKDTMKKGCYYYVQLVFPENTIVTIIPASPIQFY